MNSNRFAATVLCVAALAATTASAQVVGGRWTKWKILEGANAADWFSLSVAGAGDVNRDGYPDIIVGAPYADPAGNTSAGSVYVYSGKDFSLIRRFDGTAEHMRFGSAVDGAGDVNRDGYDDVIVGAPHAEPGGMSSAGSVYVYSGKDQTLIWQFDGAAAGDEFGTSVAGAGDVNKDGFADVIAGAPRVDPAKKNDAGAAFIYSGKDKSLIWKIDGALAEDEFGFSVDGAGDVNNDGFADVIIGAHLASPGGKSRAGSAFLYSGKDKSPIWRFDGTATDDFLGNSVAGAGDVNGDRRPDVIVGAYGAGPAGSAFVLSGKDKSLIWRLDGVGPGSSFGFCVDGAGDVDHDGYADLIVGHRYARPSGRLGAGSAFLFSGKDKSLIHRFDGAAQDDQLGRSVAGAGDVNQDGYADVIVGTTADPGGRVNAGTAELHGFNPFLVPSKEHVSVVYGGIVGYRLLFPPEHADDNYIILISASPPGQFHFGVDIPLGMDPLVIHTVFYDIGYGVYQYRFRGKLDSDCRSLAILGFQGGIFSSAVGLTVRLAAISYPDGFFPAAASVAVPLKLVR